MRFASSRYSLLLFKLEHKDTSYMEWNNIPYIIIGPGGNFLALTFILINIFFSLKITIIKCVYIIINNNKLLSIFHHSTMPYILIVTSCCTPKGTILAHYF